MRTVVAGGLFTHLGAGGTVHERGRWRATTLTSFTSFGGPSPGRQGGMLWLVVTHFHQGKAPHEEDPDERDLHRQRPTGYLEGTTVGKFTVKTGGRARFHRVGCPVPEGPVAATLEGGRNHWGGRQHGFGCLQPTGRVLAVLGREGVVGPTSAAQGGRCCGGRPAAPFQYGHLVVGRPEPVGYAAGGVDVVGGAEEVSAMAMTEDRLEKLPGSRGGLLDQHDAAIPVDAWVAAGAPASRVAAGDGSWRPVARKPFGACLLEPITGRWAAIGAVAWLVLLPIGMAVEPVPDNPNAVDPWFVSALATVLVGALAGTVGGFWARRRLGLAASLLASSLLMVSTVMCPVSGHHTHLGAWWVVQLGCGLGLVTTSVLGLRRVAPRV